MAIAWSYSRLACYEECPLKFKFKFIDKLPEPSSEAMERGSTIHKEAEAYVKNGGKLPTSLKLFRKEFTAVRKEPEIAAESQWAFTKLWHTTSWFAKDTACRMVVDLAVLNADTVRAIDYKTGKVRDGYERQVSFYAFGAFLLWAVENVKTELWFLDHGKTITHEYTRKEHFKVLKKQWTDAPRAMLADTRFAPRPGSGCRWCSFGVSKGGTCKYG